MKAPIEGSIKLPLHDSQPISMQMGSVLVMLLHYYPKTAKGLIEKSIIKAQKEHRLNMGANYCATFDDKENSMKEFVNGI